MKTIGRFKIKDSFKITRRGLVAVGDIIEGRVKIGSFITFDAGTKSVTMKIAGVDMGDTLSTGEYFVGLTFAYKNENERMELETLKLKEQIVSETEEMLNSLLKISAAKTSYIGDAIHEIRNAMTGFRTVVLVIQAKANNLVNINEDWPAIAERTNNAFEVLRDVTDNVIKYSKIEAGKDEFDSIETVNIRSLIQTIVKANEFTALDKEIKITVSIADNLPEKIITDTIFITRILSKLIINSIKFTHRQGNIIVSAFSNNDGEYWSISVEDDGAGIAHKEFTRIFDAFATNKNKEDNPEGIGLGLYIVKKLVKLMQGKITLSSHPGKATCFTVSIPFRLQFEVFAEINTADT